MQQIEPDALTVAYREQVLSSLELVTVVGVVGCSLLVFLVAVLTVRKL